MNTSSPAQKVLEQQKGIGLIEVLIAMFVLAVGALALGKIHADFFAVTGINKARTEALAIAQGRIEDMRNYMHEATNLDEFNTIYPTGANANVKTIDGVNARFSRKETITENGEALRIIAVTVDWADAAGESQSITLDTELAFIPPGAAGTLAAVRDGIRVRSPMGRAKLGRGNVPDGVEPDSNKDGTGTYMDIANGNRNLVSGQKIVLTLEDACYSEVECTDFVQIKGRVFIDKATQSTLKPQDVYIQASDAAFCARYHKDPDSEDNNKPIEEITDNSLLLTDNGDYYRFDYTCYLGGGWHGNIGILFSDGSNQPDAIKLTDKICQGDPVSTNGWDAPVIAARRAYRGMIYTKDSGVNKVYKSYGIRDGAILGDPSDSEHPEHPHDFIISSMSKPSVEGSNCISQGIMVRADATVDDVAGGLFEGNPDDFVCLNNGYLDEYDVALYGNDPTCPYDPTSPPVDRHAIKGLVTVDWGDSIISESILASIGVNTSDGPGNCHWESEFGDPDLPLNNAEYTCDVFDWGSGWKGMIHTAAVGNELTVSCDPSPREFTSAVTGDISTGNDIHCTVDKYALISGGITTVDPLKVLKSVTINDGGSIRACSVSEGGLTYECISNAYQADWSGELVFTLTGGVLCPATGDVTTGTLELDSGIATATAITGDNDLNLDVQDNLGACL